MRDPSPEQFTQALAELSQPALVAFVADLWAAQGWEIRVDDSANDGRLVCTRDDEVTTVLVPERESVRSRVRRGVYNWVGRGDDRFVESVESVETNVDVVVSPTGDTRAHSLAKACDARLYDGHSLYEFALYAVDRREADAAFHRHLGSGIEVFTASTPADHGSAPDTDHGSTPWWPRSWARSNYALVLALVVGSLLVASGFGISLGVDGRSPVLGGADEVITPAASEPDRADSPTDPFGTGPPPGAGESDDPDEVALDFGLAPSGQADSDSLARAHATAVDGRSYIWRVNYTARRGESVTRADAVHRIRDAQTFRVDVETTGTLAADPGPFVPRPAYADGETRYVLSRGQVVRRPLESSDHYAGHAQRALSELLRANETDITDMRVVRGTALYRVSLEGTPDPSRTQYRAVAFVSPKGVVYLIEAQWVERDTDVSVMVRSTYDFVGDPDVTRPEWVEPTTAVPTATATNESTPTAGSVTTTPTPTATSA